MKLPMKVAGMCLLVGEVPQKMSLLLGEVPEKLSLLILEAPEAGPGSLMLRFGVCQLLIVSSCTSSVPDAFDHGQ